MQEWYYTPGGVIDYNYPLPNTSLEPNAGAMIGIELLSHCDFETNNGSACYNTSPTNCNDPAKININYSDGSYTPSRIYNNTIINCTITNGSHCISLANAKNNTITRNTITNGSNRGIIFSSRSNNNSISQNTISLCGSTGVHLCYGAFSNTISNNTVHSTRGGEGDGIKAYVNCNYNIIENNTVYNCPQAGIRVAHGANNNTIRNNTITGPSDWSTNTDRKGIKIYANSWRLYCLDKLQYGNALTANNNVCTGNTISNVNTGISIGDEKGFGGNFLNNIVSNNTITNTITAINSNVMSYISVLDGHPYPGVTNC